MGTGVGPRLRLLLCLGPSAPGKKAPSFLSSHHGGQAWAGLCRDP